MMEAGPGLTSQYIDTCQAGKHARLGKHTIIFVLSILPQKYNGIE